MKLRSLFKSLLHRARVEGEMDEELRFHITSYIDDLRRSGLSRDEAERRARLEFGNLELHKESCRDSLGLRLWNELRSDLRYALRGLQQSPGFTAVAVISLALGIGANTAIFSLAEDVLLKSLPVSHPEQFRLLSWTEVPHSPIHNVWGDVPGVHASLSYPVFKELQRQNHVFRSLFAFKNLHGVTTTIDGHAEETEAELVTGNFYQALGLRAEAGRAITPADDRNESAVVVISGSFWARRFGRSASVIGKRIDLNRTPVTIIGVNPPSFTGMQTGFYPDFFLPISLQPQVIPSEFAIGGSLLTSAEQFWVPLMGRLKSGVSDKQALAELNVIFAQAIKSTLPHEKNTNMPSIRFVDGNRGLDLLKNSFKKPIYVLLALVSLLLLIACVNLANLLLARSAARQHEMGVRIALGAGRARILRQVFTECLLLASLGGMIGLALGYCTRNLVPFLMSTSWENHHLNAVFDRRVVAFTLGVTFLTALLFGVLPAWRSTKADANGALGNSRRMTKSFDKTILGRLLIILQVSLSVLLLIGAGLFTRTLLNLQSSGLGFNPVHILLFDVDLPRSQYAAEHRAQTYQAIESALAQVPSVSSISLSEMALLSNSTSTTDVRVAEKPNAPQPTWRNLVGPDFFRTMGIPILYGRSFDNHDTQNSEDVAIINQRLAQKLFPNENPVGRIIRTGGRFESRDGVKVIGVSGDAKFSDLRTPPPPTTYLDYRQQKEMGNATFEVKTIAQSDSLIPSLRKAVASVDKDLPLIGIRTQDEQIAATLSEEKTFSTLTTGFGLLALILASIGIYGIMAYNVARRVNEIGIRLALGAQAGQILSMVLREGLLLAIAGVGLGILATLPLTRLVTAIALRHFAQRSPHAHRRDRDSLHNRPSRSVPSRAQGFPY
jgi:predicted permease